MDDIDASMDTIVTAQLVQESARRSAASVWMVNNNTKTAIQLSVETPLQESLRDIPRLDETT